MTIFGVRYVAYVLLASIVVGLATVAVHRFVVYEQQVGADKVQLIFDQYKLTEAAQTEKILQQNEARQVALQAEADQTRSEKDAQIKSLNSRLATTLAGLRDRASRPAPSSAGSVPSPAASAPAASATGANLYRQDAEFLAGEAARADRLRADLIECQQRYGEAVAALSPQH